MDFSAFSDSTTITNQQQSSPEMFILFKLLPKNTETTRHVQTSSFKLHQFSKKASLFIGGPVALVVSWSAQSPKLPAIPVRIPLTEQH